MKLTAPFLLDGAMATELMARGLDHEKEPADLWNRTRPDEVQRVHSAYFDAGCDAVQTNTFGSNRVRLATFGLAKEVRALNLAGALLAREVRLSGRRVIGSMGSTGTTRVDAAEIEDVFAEQAAALAEGGVDFLHLETFCDPDEARAALRGAHAGAPGLAAVASMACIRSEDGLRTPTGATIEAMLAAFLDGGAAAVGTNCSLPPGDMLAIVEILRVAKLAIFAKPVDARPAAAVLALLDAGATAIGGCCGSTPADLAAIAAALGRRAKPV